LPANFAFYDEWGQEMNAAVADVNGDGLADLLSDVVYLNNGVNGWATTTPSWTVPVGFTNYNATLSPNIYLGDVNGDGLTDIVVLGSGGGTLYKNTGSSWTIDNSWTIPGMAPDSLNDWGVRMIDLNGDGLPDFFRSWQEYQGSPPTVVDREAFWLNTGSGWASDSNWHMPGGALMVDPNLNPYGLQIGDFNGDALPDLLRSWSQYDTGGGCCEYKNAEWVNNGSRTDLLTTVTYPQGGNTTVTYKPSAKYMSGSTILNPHLPMALDVVYQTTSTDGNGSSFTDTYTYKNGAFYYNNAFDRQLAGFAEVDKSDGAGNVTKTFYHTGGGTDSSHGEYSDNFFKIGKSYRVEKYDNSGNLYEKIINKWDHSAISDSAAGFVKLAQTVNSIYDGDTSHKDKAESYTYNSSTGDVTQKVEWGEVTGSDDGTFSDTGSDKFTTDYGYATSSTSSIMSLLNHIIVTDQNSTKVKETKYYFDNLSFGTVDKGNQTKEEDWKSGSDYINTQKTYNGYGLVITSTDPRGKQTTYTYDAYKLYPVTVTNPVSQVMQYVYDYSSGKVATSTDANGNMFVAKYDGLDRLTEQKQPDPSATSTLLTKLSVTYTDTSGSVSVQKSENLDGSTVADIYVYYDGLGRQIQERKEAEGSNFATRDFSYNNIGLMNKESLPYFSSGSNKTTATTTAALFTAYTFDALLRPKTEANAVGTTTVSHLDWKVTVTDPRGKTKDLYNDAFDNLIQVDEHNSTSTYTTLYSYNYLGNLTSITDALSNVRNFTYDGLGRRLTAQDLHSSGDGAYGSYTYTYDDAGNLTQKVDPKSQTINYTYDDINRQLTEDYTGSGGTEVTYTFDTCTQGKGRLCSASSSAVSILNAYNALGQLTNSTSTINSTAYPSSYMYDRLGNLLTITNPDGSQVKYTYNSAGQLETVQRKESTDGGYSNLVTNFDYSPTEQVATIAYANGASITNTYDPAQIYRLSNKSTTSGTSTVQSLAYLYDADGNITKITDNSNTHSAKVVDYGYDDLNRLTSASSSLASFGGNYLQTYAYDALGNITSKSDLGSAFPGSNGADQFAPIPTPAFAPWPPRNALS
jgi:YD repeat-containing protein